MEQRVADFKVSFRVKMVDADMSGEPAKIVAPLEVAGWGDGGVDEGVEPATPAEPGMTGDEGVEPGLTGEPDAPAMNRAAEAACTADEGPRQPRTRRQLDDLDDGRSTLFECRSLRHRGGVASSNGPPEFRGNPWFSFAHQWCDNQWHALF